MNADPLVELRVRVPLSFVVWCKQKAENEGASLAAIVRDAILLYKLREADLGR